MTDTPLKPIANTSEDTMAASEGEELLAWLHDATVLRWGVPNFTEVKDLTVDVQAASDAGHHKIEGRCVRITFHGVRSVSLLLIGWTAGPTGEWIDNIVRSGVAIGNDPYRASFLGWTIRCTAGSRCDVVCEGVNVEVLG